MNFNLQQCSAHESSSPKHNDKFRLTVVNHLHVECMAKLCEPFYKNFFHKSDHLKKVSTTSTGFSNHIDNLPTVFSEKVVGLQIALKWECFYLVGQRRWSSHYLRKTFEENIARMLMIINSTRFFISCRRRWKKKDCEEVGLVISHQIYSELKKLQTSNFPKRNHFLCLKGNTESHDHKNMSSSIIDQCSYIAIPMLSLSAET